MSNRKAFKLKDGAITLGAMVLPAAHAAEAPVQIAACSPCKAKSPCSPCAAKNPCNPCAAKNPCNPCAAKHPCNPCAAKKKM